MIATVLENDTNVGVFEWMEDAEPLLKVAMLAIATLACLSQPDPHPLLHRLRLSQPSDAASTAAAQRRSVSPPRGGAARAARGREGRDGACDRGFMVGGAIAERLKAV